MKNKIINFFYKHRFIDTHIGVFNCHLWIYVMATYFDMYIFEIHLTISRITIIQFGIELNKTGEPRMFSFTLKLFNRGIDTEKEYIQKCHKSYENHMVNKKKAFKEFTNDLTAEELETAKKYRDLHTY